MKVTKSESSKGGGSKPKKEKPEMKRHFKLGELFKL